jgi:hypothetical protein
MEQRKYSVTEIDRMRYSVQCMYMGPFNPELVEGRLRTYMVNGTEPEELEQAATERMRADQERIAKSSFGPGSIRRVSAAGEWLV